MRVWAELAALFGRLPGSITSLEKSTMQETKLISALFKKSYSESPSSPPPSPTHTPPLSLLPLPSPHPTKHSPSISYQIITWLWCIRLLGPGSASLLFCLSLCLQQHHAKVGFAHNSSKVVMRAVAVMDPNDLWRQSAFLTDGKKHILLWRLNRPMNVVNGSAGQLFALFQHTFTNLFQMTD